MAKVIYVTLTGVAFKEEELTAAAQRLLQIMKYLKPKGSDVHPALPVNRVLKEQMHETDK